MDGNNAYADDTNGNVQDDLRQQVSSIVLERADVVTADTVAIFPYSGAEALDAEYCHKLGRLLAQLLAFAVRDGGIDPRGGFVADLHGVVHERALSMERLFTFAYLTERTTLDELALSEAIGATTEPWPLVAQLVRRASFDLLGAYAERAQLEPSDTAIIDKLTTLHTRPVLDAVLAKEVERAARFGCTISLILFDVDRLSAINQQHGYGVGDRILERLGILIRQYFRQHDWVSRYSEDSIAVLLNSTDAEHASELAERVRATVEERLEFTDHRTERPVKVTLSVAVINVQAAVGDVIDPERLLADAEAAVERAKEHGRNRVERVDGYSGVLRAANPQAPEASAKHGRLSDQPAPKP
jgi:diguanylate cyclase (GGDEF)-like protein